VSTHISKGCFDVLMALLLVTSRRACTVQSDTEMIKKKFKDTGGVPTATAGKMPQL